MQRIYQELPLVRHQLDKQTSLRTDKKKIIQKIEKTESSLNESNSNHQKNIDCLSGAMMADSIEFKIKNRKKNLELWPTDLMRMESDSLT